MSHQYMHDALNKGIEIVNYFAMAVFVLWVVVVSIRYLQNYKRKSLDEGKK